MKKNQTNQVSSKDIASSIALVAKMAALFSDVARMTAADKSRLAKMKPGATAVIPTIASIATKFALELPGMPTADMESNVAYAQSLEPLLGAVSAFYETLRDEHLRANAAAWTTATVTYGMLKNGSRADQNIANELAPVQKWFRQVARRKHTATTTTSASKASPQASSSTVSVPATKPTGATNGAPVVTAPATPASPVVAVPVNGAASN